MPRVQVGASSCAILRRSGKTMAAVRLVDLAFVVQKRKADGPRSRRPRGLRAEQVSGLATSFVKGYTARATCC